MPKKTYMVVDHGKCIACGQCMCWSPDVFTYNQLSIAENRLDGNTGTEPIPDAVLQDALDAFSHCPVEAINKSDKPFENFQHTAEFQTEGPNNPQITYHLSEAEMPTTPKTSGDCGCGGGCGCGGSNCTCGNH